MTDNMDALRKLLDIGSDATFLREMCPGGGHGAVRLIIVIVSD